MTVEELIDLAIENKKDLAIETKHPVLYGHRVERELAKLLERKRSAIRESGIQIFLMSFSWWATSANSQTPHTGTYLIHSKHNLVFSRFATAGLNIEILRNGYIPQHPESTLVWTVNSESDILLCKKLGVDVIITDDVQLAKSV